MLKLDFRIPAAIFFAVLICFGCSRPEATVPDDSAQQTTLPSQFDKPAHQKARPRQQALPEINRPSPTDKARQAIIQTAVAAVGTPYVWGGFSPNGFDCSGLVVYAYKKIGIHVPRTAKAQFTNCKSVNRKNIKAGDLVFFSIPRRRGAVHVGIYIGNGQFIHAPGRGRKVRRTALNNIYFKQHFIKAGNFFHNGYGRI